MAANRTKRHAHLLESAKLAADIPSKLDYLIQLKEDLVHEDPALLSEFLPRLYELQSDRFSPVRKFAAEYVFFWLYICSCKLVLLHSVCFPRKLQKI